MKLARRAVFILLLILVLVSGLIGYLTITEFKPEDVLPVQISQQPDRIIDESDELTITSFNIGYASLDRDADFFMDGGAMSRGFSQERVEHNLAGIIDILTTLNSDFYLLQEVDEDSARSYGINQREQIAERFSDYSSSYGINYKVAWVPVPLTRPMGRVLSGIQTLSRFSVNEATRYALPGEYSWPTRLAQLDRCLLESRISVSNGKELVIGHLHLSAFDQAGFIRSQELEFLETYARKEAAKGNYVILGGDWNHLLDKNPQEKRARLSAIWPDWLRLLPNDFLSEFFWGFDDSVPSNRALDDVYDPLVSFEATIDGFLVSPNIEIMEVNGHDLGFEFSDHNPVTMRIRFEQPLQNEAEIQEEQVEEEDA